MKRDQATAPGAPPSAAVRADNTFDYDGSTFAEVKEAAFAGPYAQLPSYQGLGPTTFVQFCNASARNLADKRDLRPHYDKLIHANGICFAGVWRIDRESPYSGYFAQGACGLLLARFSIAGPQVTRGRRRALGIAGKIWPGMDPTAKAKPANFVTVTDLSGSAEPYVTNLAPTNGPAVGLSPAAILINRVIFRLMDTRPGYRLLYPISALGLPPGAPVVTPDLMRLRVADGTPRVDADDFRDELRLRHYPNGILTYTISGKQFGDAAWLPLGRMELTEDAVSEGQDKRLHFWIPQDIPSLN